MNARLISLRKFPPDMVAHLRLLAAERPGDTALIAVHQAGDEIVERKFDYETLDRHSRALAAVLQDRFAPGDRALLLLDNDEHYVIGFFACLYAGLIAVPVFPPEAVHERHLARLLSIASDAEARCILTTVELMPLICNAAVDQFSFATVVAVDAVRSSDASAWREHMPKSDDIAFLQYTSGSTSTPKGVMVSHGNLMVNSKTFEQSLSISAEDTFVNWLPLYHDLGLIGGLLQPIHRGIPVVLMTPKFFIERPVRWLEAISRHRATVSGAPNFAFQLCVERVRDAQLQGLDLSSWRVAFCGAEPVRLSTMSAFSERFAPVGFSAGALYPCYGLAEATLLITGGGRGDGVRAHRFSPEMLAQGRAEVAEQGTPVVSCGIPISDHTVRIVEPETFVQLADGNVGEIWIGGQSLTQGYWRRSQETALTFVHHDKGRWLRTGDLGFIHDGEVYIAGRHKDLIIIRGQNVYPQDLEQVVEEEVEAARKGRVAAFAVETETGEGIGIAVEISRGMQKLIPVEALVRALSEAVSGSCHEPLSVVVLLNPGALPKTSSGKLKRGACRQGWLERTLNAYAIYELGKFVLGGNARPAERPIDETEVALASIWEKVLNRKGLGREDHFFASGGNSLAAVQAAARIADHWHLDFPPRSLFENPRLHECATEIKRILSTGASLHGATVTILPTRSRTDPNNAAPLSFGQQRLWFLWQLDSSSTAYHIKHALRFSGSMDVKALGASFEDMIRRHDSLRTFFRPGPSGAAEQVIRRVVPFAISHIDLRETVILQGEARVAEEAERFVSTPFDLTQGPLLRVALIRTAEDEHILVMVMHHIISDGASIQIMLDELAASYVARLQGEAAHMDQLPIRYSDYAAWQREWLEAGEKDKQLAYWRGYLGNEDAVLTLPADNPRQPIANYRAARYSFDVPPDVLDGLRRLAQERGATLFMTLLAGFQALLYRHTEQPDIRLGVPVANRNRLETLGLIGFFVNTQVLRGQLNGRMQLAQLLDQAREAVIDAQANQDLPFEQLVEALQPQRSLSHSPLFQVTINHLVMNRHKLQQLPGLKVTDFPLAEQAAQFELTLETVESPDGSVRASFIYASELFDPHTTERLGLHYIDVLRAFAQRPEQAVGDVALLSERDRLQLEDWGTNKSSFKSSFPQVQPVYRLIASRAEAYPTGTAVVFGDIKLTYSELNLRSNRLAHTLIGMGVRPETKVGISTERSIDMIIGLFAILKAGGGYVPLDPDYPPQRLSHMVEDSGIQLLLAQTHTRACVPNCTNLQVLELDALDLSSGIDTDPQVPLHEDNLAYVIYTSGSTGRPKGVAVTHGPLAMHLDAIKQIYDVRPGDRELMFFSMNFDAAAEQWMTPLCGGGTLVLSSTRSLATDSFADLITTQGITTLHLPPAYLRLLLPLVPKGESSVRVCIAGGEAWFAADLAATQEVFAEVRLVNAYGPTETVITPAAWISNGKSTAIGDYAPIGRPVGQRSLYVLDSELNFAPVGAPGELYVGGTGMARGYLNRPELTADRFIPDPFGLGGGRLYRTGDRVRWRSDGQLEYIGRLDQQIKIRGFRVELGEIEAQLLAQAGVRDAVVVARAGRTGLRLIAYIVAHAGVLLNAGTLKTALRAVLPDYMLPSSIVFLEALPLSPNGKVDRNALPLPEQFEEQDYESPVTQIEKLVSETWADILEVPRVGLHSNFFDLGGHSLLLIKVQCKLEEQLNTPIAIVDLFRHTTVASLARFLAEERAEDSSLLRHRERAQRQRGNFIQRKHRAGSTH
jgi:amino acid adenylation domain-containing protein